MPLTTASSRADCTVNVTGRTFRSGTGTAASSTAAAFTPVRPTCSSSSSAGATLGRQNTYAP